MSLQDRKLTNWTQPVSSLDDKPQMTAEALKAAFDSNANEIKPALNGLIDDLAGIGGAAYIGIQTIAGLTGTTVQAALEALKALIDALETPDLRSRRIRPPRTSWSRPLRSIRITASLPSRRTTARRRPSTPCWRKSR